MSLTRRIFGSSMRYRVGMVVVSRAFLHEKKMNVRDRVEGSIRCPYVFEQVVVSDRRLEFYIVNRWNIYVDG